MTVGMLQFLEQLQMNCKNQESLLSIQPRTFQITLQEPERAWKCFAKCKTTRRTSNSVGHFSTQSAALHIGQSIAVRDGDVLAVEAIEGTASTD